MTSLTTPASWYPLLPLEKGGGEGGGAGFVITGSLAVVGGAVDGDSPHGGGIAVTVAVILRSSVS
jgi:hypothetical protein